MSSLKHILYKTICHNQIDRSLYKTLDNVKKGLTHPEPSMLSGLYSFSARRECPFPHYQERHCKPPSWALFSVLPSPFFLKLLTGPLCWGGDEGALSDSHLQSFHTSDAEGPTAAGCSFHSPTSSPSSSKHCHVYELLPRAGTSLYN